MSLVCDALAGPEYSKQPLSRVFLDGPGRARTRLQIGAIPQPRTAPGTAPGEDERLRKQRRIVGFGLVNQDVGVGVSGQGQVYFGWYAWNVLELDARDIALHFGHQDGGDRPRQSRSSLRV
jgi:hypothetical protein